MTASRVRASERIFYCMVFQSTVQTLPPPIVTKQKVKEVN